MTTRVGDNILVELNQVTQMGTPWQVRVYKKVLGFKKQVSCDWFLDEGQATRFAEQIAKELGSSDSTANLKQRKPGWTLRRPSH